MAFILKICSKKTVWLKYMNRTWNANWVVFEFYISNIVFFVLLHFTNHQYQFYCYLTEFTNSFVSRRGNGYSTNTRNDEEIKSRASNYCVEAEACSTLRFRGSQIIDCFNNRQKDLWRAASQCKKSQVCYGFVPNKNFAGCRGSSFFVVHNYCSLFAGNYLH